MNQNFTDIINSLTDGTKSLSIDALTCAGTATFNGNVTLGNGTPDDITFTGSMASTLPIKTNNSFDIGTSQFGLAGVYLGSTGTKTVRLRGSDTTTSYTATLPAAVPASTKILTMASTGAIGNAYDVDGSTLEVSSNSLRVKDAGISAAKLATDAVETAKIKDLNVTTAKLADGSVTPGKKAALGQQVSSSSGAFTTSSSSFVDVTNMQVTITTTGRPVLIAIVPDGAYTGSNASTLKSSSSSTTASTFHLQVLRDATSVGVVQQLMSANVTVNSPSTPIFLDTVAAGTYTYKVQMKMVSGDSVVGVSYVKLVVFEL